MGNFWSRLLCLAPGISSVLCISWLHHLFSSASVWEVLHLVGLGVVTFIILAGRDGHALHGRAISQAGGRWGDSQNYYCVVGYTHLHHFITLGGRVIISFYYLTPRGVQYLTPRGVLISCNWFCHTHHSLTLRGVYISWFYLTLRGVVSSCQAGHLLYSVITTILIGHWTLTMHLDDWGADTHSCVICIIRGPTLPVKLEPVWTCLVTLAASEGAGMHCLVRLSLQPLQPFVLVRQSLVGGSSVLSGWASFLLGYYTHFDWTLGH